MKAFKGGGETVDEQKRLGGDPDVCSVYQYFYYLFEPDDEKMKERQERCKNGKVLCGECKKELTERINKFLEEHQKKREAARKEIDKFMLKD
jgi:tryptophanyl-tRNA synthetase